MSSYLESRPINSKEYQDSCKILAAAVISKQFREKLLSNPRMAVEAGYDGQYFQIGGEIKQKISTIQANNLSDFALQLTQNFNSSLTPIPCFAGD